MGDYFIVHNTSLKPSIEYNIHLNYCKVQNTHPTYLIVHNTSLKYCIVHNTNLNYHSALYVYTSIMILTPQLLHCHLCW